MTRRRKIQVRSLFNIHHRIWLVVLILICIMALSLSATKAVAQTEAQWLAAFQWAQQYGYTGTLDEFKDCMTAGGWAGCQFGPPSRVPVPTFPGFTRAGDFNFIPGDPPGNPPDPPPPPGPPPDDPQ